ncbi:hypothetical protein [Nonomuraea sp. NPDC049695]|uniref:hypothetical protein n=1 Tax=Nonomuraea sp. NPDC049695 TaxID=3154734 RepID=UPI0034199940
MTVHLLQALHDALTVVADQLGTLPPSPAPTRGAGSGLQLPDAPPAPPAELTAYFQRVVGGGKWIALAIALLSMIYAGTKMMAGKSNRSNLAADGAASIPWIFGGIAVVMSAASIIMFMVGS